MLTWNTWKTPMIPKNKDPWQDRIIQSKWFRFRFEFFLNFLIFFLSKNCYRKYSFCGNKWSKNCLLIFFQKIAKTSVLYSLSKKGAIDYIEMILSQYLHKLFPNITPLNLLPKNDFNCPLQAVLFCPCTIIRKIDCSIIAAN